MARPRGITWRLRWPIGAIVVVTLIGFVGFWRLDYSPLDAITRTVLVLTTIGGTEPATTAEKTLTNVVAVLGVSTYLALLAALAAVIAEGRVLEATRERRSERRIRQFEGHVIVCAYGRVGRAVAARLRAEGATFVVADRLPALTSVMRDDGMLALTAEPSDEETLRRLGVMRARALISAVDSDADNVFITLTARSLNPDLFIVARASERTTADRLYRAGADRVVSPYVSSGRQMALLATRHRVVDSVELAAPDRRVALRMEELLVEDGSPLVGRTLREACGQATPLALRTGDGEVIAPPDGGEVLGAGALVVLLGEAGQLATAEGGEL